MTDNRRQDPSMGRRSFLAGSIGGLALARSAAALGEARPAGEPKAQAVIQIMLEGGLSHLDSFDPKPYQPVEIRGEFGTVSSKVDKEPFSRSLRRTAAIADRITVIRSMTHGEAAHERGTHNLLTGYKPSPAITYPSFGSVVAHELGGRQSIPPYIVIPGVRGFAGSYLGSGYLSAAYGPFSTRSDPGGRSFRVKDLAPPKGVDPERQTRRRELAGLVGAGLGGARKVDGVKAAEAFSEQAWEMLGSKSAREAFDLRKESGKMRQSYGTRGIGARLLLARRLVEAGARYVVVRDGGYDNHRNIYRTLRPRLEAVDLGFSRLIVDLDQRGLLDNTLVLLTTEFGRTSRVNQDRGRDHWPKVFSIAMAGGGTKRGLIYGASDAQGREPDEFGVTPADLAATLFSLTGIDPEKRLLAPGGRPIDIVRGGKILTDVLA